jgi:ABC-type branched-subunit amino acid transport system permease subunit
MAIGAYAAYKFSNGVEIGALSIPPLPVFVSMLLGGFMAAFVGILFGIPSLRSCASRGSIWRWLRWRRSSSSTGCSSA